MLGEQIDVVLQVTSVLDALDIPYALGGSFASGAYGVMRSTLDADLVAELQMDNAVSLADALGVDFYADVEMIREAIRRRSSFNLIHLSTMFKVDLFVAKARPFDRAQLDRRQEHQLGGLPENRVYVSSAEDIVLAKLEWYRMGGEVSERQWRDVLGVVRVQGERLDRDYMREMAVTLDVVDLLKRALAEAA